VTARWELQGECGNGKAQMGWDGHGHGRGRRHGMHVLYARSPSDMQDSRVHVSRHMPAELAAGEALGVYISIQMQVLASQQQNTKRFRVVQ